jgi:hypothetical protein
MAESSKIDALTTLVETNTQALADLNATFTKAVRELLK